MITLEIRRADGSHYWTERFDDLNSCSAWLVEEQSRPYWGNGLDGKSKEVWTWTISDDSPTQEQIDAKRAVEAEKQKKLSDAFNRLKSFDKSVLKDPGVADVFENMMILMGIK